MNTRLLRKIIGLILSALLLTSIVLLAGTTAAAQRPYQRREVIVRPINPIRPIRTVQPIRPFATLVPLVDLITRSGIRMEVMIGTPSTANTSSAMVIRRTAADTRME